MGAHPTHLQQAVTQAIRHPEHQGRIRKLWLQVAQDSVLDESEFYTFVATLLSLPVHDQERGAGEIGSLFPASNVSVGDQQKWAAEAFKHIDTNKDGKIDFLEFVQFLQHPFDAGLDSNVHLTSTTGGRNDINADLNYLGPKCKDCEAWQTPDKLQGTNASVIHNGCPMKFGPNPGEEFVAGSNPCKPFNEFYSTALKNLTGYWEGQNADKSLHCSWAFDGTDVRPVRNKRFLVEQCLQVLNFEYTEREVSTGRIVHFERGMFLVEWVAPGESGAASKRISCHFVATKGKKQTVEVVLLNPVESGLLMQVKAADVREQRKYTREGLSPAANQLLPSIPRDLTMDFFWDMLGGDRISHSGTAPPKKDDMSLAVAVSGEHIVLFAKSVPSHGDGLVNLSRTSRTPKYVPPFIGVGDENAGSDEWKGWIHMINELDGEWESTLHFSRGNPKFGDLVAVTCPPHHVDTIEAVQTQNLPAALGVLGIPGDLQIFTLCTHAHTVDSFKIRRNLLTPDANGELQILDYEQRIVDSYGNAVHEEIGFIVFDWGRREVARYGVIPHGSSFHMSGKMQHQTRPLGWIHTSTLPHFAPHFEDGLDPTVPGVKNKSATFLSGLEAGPTCNVFKEKPYVSLHNPAKLLHDINYSMESDLKEITTLNLASGKSMDLSSVNELSMHNISPNAKRTEENIRNNKFINDISSQFYLSEYKNNPTTLQYVQTINFDFAVKGTPALGKRASTKSDEKRELLRWPHVIVSSLAKKKAPTHTSRPIPITTFSAPMTTSSSSSHLAGTPPRLDSPARNRRVSDASSSSLYPDSPLQSARVRPGQHGFESGRNSPVVRGRTMVQAVVDASSSSSLLTSLSEDKDFSDYCRDITSCHRGLPQFHSSPLLKKKLQVYKTAKTAGQPIPVEDLDALRWELLHNAGVKNISEALRWAKCMTDGDCKKTEEIVTIPLKNWHNWSKTMHYDVEYKQPVDIKELKKIIRAARAAGEKYAWSEMDILGVQLLQPKE